MKLLLIAVMLIGASVANAQMNTQVLETETINVDGYVSEKQTTDGELENIKSEIAKQKKEVVLNKEKAKSYAVLSKSVEKLSETTEEYIEEKKAAQAEIAAYNLKVKCMQSDSPGPECDKYVRRR
jgi:Fe-S cluster assembly iron-binding protein IscA